MFWNRNKPQRELTVGRQYATPGAWKRYADDMTPLREPIYDHDALGVPVLPGFEPAAEQCSCGAAHGVFDVEKEGLYEPSLGADAVYAITITDGSGSQIVYTDDNPIIHVREV